MILAQKTVWFFLAIQCAEVTSGTAVLLVNHFLYRASCYCCWQSISQGLNQSVRASHEWLQFVLVGQLNS